MKPTVKMHLSSQELTEAISELQSLLEKSPNLPLEVRDFTFSLFKTSSKFCRLESTAASGTGVSVLLKPSNLLLDLLSALRTRDFQRLVIKE